MWKTAKIFNFWNTLQDCASNMNCSNIEVINLKFNVCIARQSMLITSRILQCVENNDMTSSTLINIRMIVPGMEVSASSLHRIVLLLFPLHCNDWTMCRLPGPNLPCLLPPPPEPQPSPSPVPHSCNLSVQTLSLWAGASDWGSPCRYVLLDHGQAVPKMRFLKFVKGVCFQNLRFEFELPLRNLPWGRRDKKWRYQN